MKQCLYVYNTANVKNIISEKKKKKKQNRKKRKKKERGQIGIDTDL